jgi:AraC family transcriptional regulator
LLPDRLNRTLDGLNLFHKSTDFCDGPPVQSARRLCREFHQHDAASQLAIEALVLEVLAGVARMDPGPSTCDCPPNWLRRVRERLHDRLAENVTLTSLAESAGVHVTHLARAFRRYHGCSVGEYVRRLRVEAAKRQLIQTEARLADIAAGAGFYDQAHFARVFQRLTGQTPSVFRRVARR